MSGYKCKICGAKICWDNSFGYEEFLICTPCANKLRDRFEWDEFMPVLFAMGTISREELARKAEKIKAGHYDPQFHEGLLQAQKEK